MMRPVSIGNRVGAGQYVNQVTYRTNSADHLLDDEMQTPVHAGGHDYPAVRDRGAGFSLAAQARGKEPAPGSAIPANRQSLPGGRLVGDNRNGTEVPHPVEKWPPIRGRVDVARR